ncbi:methyl-accepting chemotaxis protein [Psychromonas sp. MME2]|uniref:methyl-accepting chemotaxis protein n=1 Tax=Psychromonas sp. MME2 TaxID=3231033 RepID=UPI00339C4D94
MLIKQKLRASTLVTAVSMLAMLLLMTFAATSFKQDIVLTENIGKIETSIWKLRTHEKDFLVSKKNEYYETFNNEILALQTQINKLDYDLRNINRSSEEPLRLGKLLNEYQNIFIEVFNTQKRIGFDSQSGFYGQLRETAHTAEVEIGDSVMFHKMMLNVRNSEKNYMLLLDDKYIDIFTEDFDNFYADVKKSYLVTPQKNAILSALDAYKNAFMSLIAAQQQLGYNDNDGLRKKLNETVSKISIVQASLVTTINDVITDYIDSMKQMTYILFAVALFISMIVTWFISHSIMGAILHIKNSIIKISETNDLTISVSTKSNDELADMAKAFNYMVSNFQRLLASVKKSEATSADSKKILEENPLWADFIYDELLEGSKDKK